MKKLFLYLSLFFGMLLSSPLSKATDTYFAQTAAGAANGTSCANAYAWTDGTHGINVAGNWIAGNVLHLCGTIASNVTAQGDGTSGHVITIRFEPGAKFSTAAFSGSYIKPNGHSYLLIDGGTNGIIENTANGTLLANQVASTAIDMYQACGHDIEIKNLTIQNMYVREPNNTTDVSAGTNSEGILAIGCGNNIHIHHNTINNAHASVQLACGHATCTNWEVDHNTLSAFTWGVRTTTGNNSSVALDHVYIHDNDITITQNWCCNGANFHIDGLFADASGSVDGAGSIDFLYQYNNYIHGDGGSPGPSGWIYDNQNNHHNYIFNNVLAQGSPGNGASDGYITYGINASDFLIANNTIVGFGITTPTGGAFKDFATVTLPIVIQDNLVYNTSTAASLQHSGTPAPIDFNAYFQICSSTPLTSCPGNTGWDSLGFNAWKAGGQDTHSVYGDTKLTPTPPYVLQRDSAAIGVGNNLYATFGCSAPVVPGLGAGCSSAPQTFGVGGSCGVGCQTRAASGNWDAGAYQYTGMATYWTPNLPAASSGPTFRTLPWSGFPDGEGTTLDSSAVGQYVTFTVNVATAGTYDVKYSTKEYDTRGIAQLSINGTNVGAPQDQYAPCCTYVTYDLGNYNFATAGNYSFKFTVTGKNASSTGYTMAWDDITLK